MASMRLTMRKIKEIIRLKFGVGLSLRAIQQSLNVSYGTVSNYIRRAEQAGLGWPLPPDIDERTLGCWIACKIDPGFAQEFNPPGSSQAPNCTVFFILEVGDSNMQILATIGSILGAIQQEGSWCRL